MCAYPPSQHTLPHSKCVLHFCANCPCFDLPGQKFDNHHSNTCPMIFFYVYHLVACCSVHGRRPFMIFYFFLCLRDLTYVILTKIFARKELFMTETSISDFHTSFYIPEIQKPAFYLTHVHILGTNHCGSTRREAFKRRISFQYMLCCYGYSEIVISSFSHQIIYAYYDINRYVSIEGIEF